MKLLGDVGMSRISVLRKTVALVAFALTCIPVLAGGPFRVAIVGDPQVDNAAEMGYARESVYRELSGRKDIDLCLFLGDLVNDDMALLPESVQIIDSLPFPCLMVPGNHDRDVYRGSKVLHLEGTSEAKRDRQQNIDRPRDLYTWRKTVGYVDTAFVSGGVRFILMNNVRYANAGMADYEGGFTTAQKHWLDSVLHVSVSGRRRAMRKYESPALTILATHIPFSQMKDRDSVLAMIPDLSRTLFISGHTHYVSRGCIKRTSDSEEASELIAGAACGSWWRGAKGADGVPYALQGCGAPRGYFIADIRRDGDYRLSYKCIGRPESEQLSVWAVPYNSALDMTKQAGRLTAPGSMDVHVKEPDIARSGISRGNAGRVANLKQDSDGNPRHQRAERTTGHGQDYRLHTTASGRDSGSSSRYRFYINVFGGSADGVTKISIPRKYRRSARPSGFRHLPCTQSSATAPEVEEVIRFNASMSREYRKAHRDEFIPLRRKPSPHLWQSDDTIHGVPPAYVNVRYHDRNMRLRMINVPVQKAEAVYPGLQVR